jgi:hypothetical protein
MWGCRYRSVEGDRASFVRRSVNVKRATRGPAARWSRMCAICSRSFETCNARTKCCGRNCGQILGKRKSVVTRLANAIARRMRRCENCAETFVARNPSGEARRGKSREGRFCSRACRDEFRRHKGGRAAVNSKASAAMPLRVRTRFEMPTISRRFSSLKSSGDTKARAWAGKSLMRI